MDFRSIACPACEQRQREQKRVQTIQFAYNYSENMLFLAEIAGNAHDMFMLFCFDDAFKHNLREQNLP
jgi:hypothetical protein